MNLLIIPQVMHINAHDYDIICGPCRVEWCADDPASGSSDAARSRTIPKRVCSAQATVMEYAVESFPDHVVSKGMWPPRSPDLTCPGFFSLGFTEGQGVCKQTASLQDLKDNISAEKRNTTK
jgi:hypothetical protein